MYFGKEVTAFFILLYVIKGHSFILVEIFIYVLFGFFFLVLSCI
jgi:hypothetical protein